MNTARVATRWASQQAGRDKRNEISTRKRLIEPSEPTTKQKLIISILVNRCPDKKSKVDPISSV
jgi:hypothetical protein